MVLNLLAVVIRHLLVGRVFANRSHSLAQHDWRLPVGQLGKTGADVWVVWVLREGYVVPFHTPPLSQVPVTLPSYSPQSIKGRVLGLEIQTVAQGCYRPSVCLATRIVKLYTVMGLPASSGWTAVSQGSSVLTCWLAPMP